MEPRGATASYDRSGDSYFLRCCSQSARALRDGLAPILGVPNQRLRVVTEDVGGAFGLKTGPYPEYLAILVAARKLGRPVHWMSNRAEAFLSDNHARDAFSEVELALDERGKFLALRIRHLGNMGAYIGAVGANIQTVNLARCLPGMYDIRLIDIGVRCVFTNTTTTAPYRGAGRPEANFMLERVIDEAARVTGIDPVKLRRRNFIKPSAMPYKTAVGTTIDSGEFETVLDKALALAELRRLQAAPARSGKARQISRARHFLHAGACRRLSARRNRAELSRRRDAGARPQRAVDRPGPRHGVHADAGGTARHRAATDRAPARRFGDGDRGLCIGRIALGDDREPCPGQDRRGDGEQGQVDRGERPGSGGGRHRVSRRPFRSGRNRSQHLPVRACRPRRGDEEARRNSRGPRHQDQRRDAADVSERLPHRRDRDRSRIPASLRSSPIPRSTIAAGRSTP